MHQQLTTERTDVTTSTLMVDLDKIEAHLRTHQQYPATRATLIAACFDLQDFSEIERTWFLGTLPDATYESADDVLAALRGEVVAAPAHEQPTPTTTPLQMDKLEAFLGKVVGDLGAAMSTALVVLGDRLGLYKALAGSGPLTPDELAERTGTHERYVREWLCAQAAGGYVSYDAETKRFWLPPEQAAALADETSPAYIPGGFYIAEAVVRAQEQVAENFRSGRGMGWGEHASCLFEGTERFFRSAYIGNLTSSWIPSLEGVEARLRTSALVADVGCGLGASTILMAKTYPKSRFRGFDAHPESIALARKRAEAEKVADRVTFEVARSTEFSGTGYDLVAHFDCLHDMGDPAGAARHVRRSLAPDGVWMIVEPLASDRVEENLNPVGRVYYSASTMLCIPASLADGAPAAALGAQAGEARIKSVVHEGGFTRFRRASQTPFNAVFEARS
jgi:SAM-dependent methyltransferase